MLEREEEIILTSHSGAEYQVANDSESFLDREPPCRRPRWTPPPVAAAEEPPAELPARPALRHRGGTPDAGGWARRRRPSVEAVEEEAPIEWAMHVGEESGFVPAEASHTHAHAKDSYDAAIEGIAPVDEDAPAEAETRMRSAASDAGVPVLVVTESMAELYAAQGHPGEALGVYRILYDRNPDNERLRHRIQEARGGARRPGRGRCRAVLRRVRHRRPGGGRVPGRRCCKARPAPVDLPEPPPAPEIASTAGLPDTAGDEAVASGAPTRPAIDRLSLGAIFGEDPSPVPPAETAAAGYKNGNASGFLLRRLRRRGRRRPRPARPSGGSVRATRAADDEDDLDQFHDWLQSLKR